MRGIDTSATTRSGSSAMACSTSAAPSAHAPTISTSGSSMRRNASSSSTWSSASRTRARAGMASSDLTAPALPASRPLYWKDQPMALADKLEQLPARPGVYLFKDKTGAIVYVGKARVLRDRVRSYFQAWRPAEQHKTSLAEEIADLELIVTDSEMEALALENNLIKRHQPYYNVRLRDDKNHPYLKLTLKEEYPRLYVVRRPGEDGNAYGGPYIPASMARRTGALVRRLFGIRSCKEVAEREAPAALPAVSDQALPGPVRRRDLPARTLSAGRRGRSAVPGRAHGGGDAPAPRADGSPPRPTSATSRPGRCATRCRRCSGSRRRRRSPPPTSRSATSSRPTSRASARRCRCSSCATARWWRARASCSTA